MDIGKQVRVISIEPAEEPTEQPATGPEPVPVSGAANSPTPKGAEVTRD